MEVSGELQTRRFISGGIAPRTHCIGGWVGPRVNLDAVE
jgi:hypothetical protein